MLHECVYAEHIVNKIIMSIIIKFTEEPFVCTDEVFAWKWFRAMQLCKRFYQIYQICGVGMAMLCGSTVHTPVEHWLAVLSQDTWSTMWLRQEKT